MIREYRQDPEVVFNFDCPRCEDSSNKLDDARELFSELVNECLSGDLDPDNFSWKLDELCGYFDIKFPGGTLKIRGKKDD